MPADEAEPVFRAEIGEVFHGKPLDAAQVDQEGAGPELADVLPHEGDRLLRVEGEKNQVAHRQVVFRDGLVDRAVRERLRKGPLVDVAAVDEVPGVFFERLCHRTADEPQPNDADAEGPLAFQPKHGIPSSWIEA